MSGIAALCLIDNDGRMKTNTALTIIFLALVWTLATGFGLYSYGPPETLSRLVEYNNWGKPDSHEFAVLVYHKKYRWPTGVINTFPDGSNVKTIRHWISVYACDADVRAGKKIGEITITENYRLNTSISLSPLWLDDTFFITVRGHDDSLRNNLWGTPHGAKPNTIIYSVSMDGVIKKIDSIPTSAKEHVPRSERLKSDYQTDFSKRFVWLAVNWLRVAVQTDESPRKGDRLLSETMFLLDKENGVLRTNPQIVLTR